MIKKLRMACVFFYKKAQKNITGPARNNSRPASYLYKVLLHKMSNKFLHAKCISIIDLRPHYLPHSLIS